MIWSAAYDDAGLRVAKTDPVNGARTYSRGPSGLLEDTGTVYTPGLGYREAGVDRAYHADRLGSVRGVSYTQGACAPGSNYPAFGATSHTAGLFGYAGAWAYQNADGPLGLLYLQQRYYDPETGRFISPDPIGYAGGLNLYAYCRNDPVNGVDPSGLAPGVDPLSGAYTPPSIVPYPHAEDAAYARSFAEVYMRNAGAGGRSGAAPGPGQRAARSATGTQGLWAQFTSWVGSWWPRRTAQPGGACPTGDVVFRLMSAEEAALVRAGGGVVTSRTSKFGEATRVFEGCPHFWPTFDYFTTSKPGWYTHLVAFRVSGDWRAPTTRIGPDAGGFSAWWVDVPAFNKAIIGTPIIMPIR